MYFYKTTGLFLSAIVLAARGSNLRGHETPPQDTLKVRCAQVSQEMRFSDCVTKLLSDRITSSENSLQPLKDKINNGSATEAEKAEYKTTKVSMDIMQIEKSNAVVEYLDAEYFLYRNCNQATTVFG